MSHASAVAVGGDKRSPLSPELFTPINPHSGLATRADAEHKNEPLANSAGVGSDPDSSAVDSTVELGDYSGTEKASDVSCEAVFDDSFDASIERLRQRSRALSRLADNMRQQFDLQPETKARPAIRSQSVEAPVPIDEAQIAPLPGRGLLESAGRFFLHAVKQPEVFVQHYTGFAKELLNIVQLRSRLEPVREDKRFRDPVWRDNFLYRAVMQSYLAWDREVAGWVEDLDMDEADRRRSRFLSEQLSALLAPTNSPLNPVAVKRAYQTGGKSILTGLKNMLDDLHTNHGMPSQVKRNSYQVGKDLANSSGAVIYRSEVLELIQYQMDERQAVCQRPLLIVPPQLNKFYIFDLTPKNSIVRYLQAQGVQPFIVSWRNPARHNSDWNMDRYVSELETALEVIRDVSGSDSVNLASACAGALTSMALLGYLQAANKPLVHSHSMFVTALRADDSFQLGLFASRQSLEISRRQSQLQGYMDGKGLSHIFAWMRPTDLVWNFWINNYLLGKEPPSMDVLYWDNDSTRLPAGLHSDFLDLFIDDAFAHPGRLRIKGLPVDIRQLSQDFYCVGGDEDYLMPWKKCFEVPSMLDTDCTFVLSTSGHVQSLLRPPGIANIAYYTSEAGLDDPDAWRQAASRHDGSWWEHWRHWLLQRSGEHRPAPSQPGNDRFPPLSPAPGLYVNEVPA